MPELKTKTVCHVQVNYNDLEVFVQEITGREWSFVAAGEYGNGEEHTFTVKNGGLDPHDAAEIFRFVNGENVYPHPTLMLDWLAFKGVIVPGEWLVSIYW